MDAALDFQEALFEAQVYGDKIRLRHLRAGRRAPEQGAPLSAPGPPLGLAVAGAVRARQPHGGRNWAAAGRLDQTDRRLERERARRERIQAAPIFCICLTPAALHYRRCRDGTIPVARRRDRPAPSHPLRLPRSASRGRWTLTGSGLYGGTCRPAAALRPRPV